MQRAASGATSLGRAATHAAAEVLQQDEHSTEWRTQRKHFFMLTNAGALVHASPSPAHVPTRGKANPEVKCSLWVFSQTFPDIQQHQL